MWIWFIWWLSFKVIFIIMMVFSYSLVPTIILEMVFLDWLMLNECWILKFIFPYFPPRVNATWFIDILYHFDIILFTLTCFLIPFMSVFNVFLKFFHDRDWRRWWRMKWPWIYDTLGDSHSFPWDQGDIRIEVLSERCHTEGNLCGFNVAFYDVPILPCGA